MITLKKTAGFILFYLCCTHFCYSQSKGSVTVALTNLDAFNNPGKDWTLVSDASTDPKEDGLKTTGGNGILINTSKKDGSNLQTKEELGDVQVSLDFMTTKASSAAIYLEGRYGVRLGDNWLNTTSTINDPGAIESRTNNENQSYEGIAPLTNESRAPGLWQHLVIKFRTPVFKNGTKVTNARFEEVYLNGVLVQVQDEVTGPTQSASLKDEAATGPLAIKVDAGAIAFKNITYTLLDPIAPPAPRNPLSRRRVVVENPITIRIQNKPYLLRGFLMFNNKKRTHVISVGTPEKVNFSYELKQGALMQIWRGQFLDVTQMWEDRGEPQLARPIGSVIPLSAAPAIAFLNDKDTAWPDSLSFDDFHNNGYVLDKSRMPTFTYNYNGADVSDKFSVINSGASLQRAITVANGTDKLYCRIIAAKNIAAQKNGTYLIGDKEYYIKVEDGYKPFIRTTSAGQELLVPIGKSTTPLTYSITW